MTCYNCGDNGHLSCERTKPKPKQDERSDDKTRSSKKSKSSISSKASKSSKASNIAHMQKMQKDMKKSFAIVETKTEET